MLSPLSSTPTADLTFNSLSYTIGFLRSYAISAVVLYMLRLVFSLQFHDSVSRREAMLIHGNRFQLVLLDNNNELWLVFHFQTVGRCMDP